MRIARSTAVAVVAGGAALVAAAAVLRARDEPARPAFERRVIGAPPPVVSRVGRARVVTTAVPPMELVLDTVPPSSSARLLWLGGRAAQPTQRGAVVIDGVGRVVEFDTHLIPHPIAIESEGREWLSVAAASGGGYWLTDATGSLYRAGEDAHLSPPSPAGFPYPAVAADPLAHGAPWVSRSSLRFTYALDTSDSPLIAERLASGGTARRLGSASRPAHILLRDLANAGHVAASAGRVYFAPFIRDEVIAFAPTGDTLWIARRALAHETPDPRFEVADGRVTISYSPVNLGMTIGPDGLLYVLSTPDRNTMHARLDVFDPDSGRLVRGAALATSQPTLAADPSGRVFLLDEASLLAGTSTRARPLAPSVAVPGLNGREVSLAQHRGHVTLVNLWASWCGPCREEMPALDSLQRAFAASDSAFAFVSFSDDVSIEAARRFVVERGFTFPVGLGRGSLRDRFHAPGLPITILLDRDGREVRRWIGYAGPEQASTIRALVRAELDRVPANVSPAMHHHGGM